MPRHLGWYKGISFNPNFDVIVGCEGFSSGVRRTADIEFPIQERFLISGRTPLNIPQLHQVRKSIDIINRIG